MGNKVTLGVVLAVWFGYVGYMAVYYTQTLNLFH